MLRSALDLEQYFNKRTQGHTCFYHYSNLCNINNIIGEHTFYISSVKRLNDANEKKVFEGDENRYYSLCFSTGQNENLSLWYLYSGIEGKGGRLSLTYKKLSKLIERSEYTLWVCDEQGKAIKEIRKLSRDEDILVTFRDILYARKSNMSPYYDLKYNTMTNHNNITEDEMVKYQEKYKGFVKGLIWYHEKESRILVRLQDHIFDSLDTDKTYLIKMCFPETLLKEFKLQFAPEITSVDEIIDNYLKIKKFLFDTSRIFLSEYSGDINMKLYDKEKICKHCQYKKG